MTEVDLTREIPNEKQNEKLTLIPSGVTNLLER